MAAVNLLVADGAVPVAGRSEIVKCRRNYARDYSGCVGHRQVRVAFEANQPHFLPDQHLRIRGAVRHVATLAAFLAHGGMLERERPAFVAVTVETARFVGVGHPHQAGFEAAVRIVAVNARHRIFRNPVLEGFGERRFHVDMAALTEGVHLRRFAYHQAFRNMRVNRMA